eukprot:PLAT13672.1.p1 GENE.PLAT13672.1~~PLAT13672.1.p1  ORF type:complete len:1322 (+),score=843.05 PLAT13672.1:114-3968(+)
MKQVEAAASDSSDPAAREGALLAIDTLSEFLGQLFEPYVISAIPLLLAAHADSGAVREAAQTAARGVMGRLTVHGVKLVLPMVLKSLSARRWRTKQAAIRLLGSTAYCAPAQLSSCLPTVVPRLRDALMDAHPEVQSAGTAALADVGSVIRSPEISALVPQLLAALADPAKKTAAALNQLQKTAFVHSIDAPSLALIQPVLTRGLRSRLTNTKKAAARIVGNICGMVNNAADLEPYLPELLPDVQAVLLDPIPAVRMVAARALGRLARGLGEDALPGLVPALIGIVKSDSSGVERSGGAQGLAEVLRAMGAARTTDVLDELLPQANHRAAHVREGVMWLLVHLPPVLGRAFADHLAASFPLIVAGLADEDESTRDAAMRAGQVVVTQHACTHTELLLPAMESGLTDGNWRIRQSSVQLLGELLFRLSGARGSSPAAVQAAVAAGLVVEGGDLPVASVDVTEAIVEVLGRETRDRLLAALYLTRSDGSAIVRQSTMLVWKSLVMNTPRTLREILPALMQSCIAALAGDDGDMRAVAGRALGEVVRKLGERVLADIVPILRDGLQAEDGETRQGVCLGLSEVIDAASRRQLDDYLDVLLPAVQAALCDALPDVREAAAQAFNMLQATVGRRAVDAIVPTLLHTLEDDAEGERALHGLREIVVLRGREVLPFLVPRLLVQPFSLPRALALAAVADAAAPVLHFHIAQLLAAMVPVLARALEESGAVPADGEDDDDSGEPLDEQTASVVGDAARTAVLAVQDGGVQWLMNELLRMVDGPDASPRTGERVAVLQLLQAFCAESGADYSTQVPQVLKAIIHSLNDSQPAVVTAAHAAFMALNGGQGAEALSRHLDFVRSLLNGIALHYRRRTGDEVFLLPGFCMKKGLAPVLPLFHHGLLHGSPEVREAAAQGLGDLIAMTDAKSLRPFLMKLAGPLIRIVSDRFPWQVKAAILATMGALIDKGGKALRSFVTQLQTTFVKALSDPNGTVRQRAAHGLAKLTGMTPRIDTLVADLVDGVESAAGGVRLAFLLALQRLYDASGERVGEESRARSQDAFVALLDVEEEPLRRLAADGLAALLLHLPEEELEPLMLDVVLAPEPHLPWQERHGRAMALAAVARRSTAVLAPYIGVVIEAVGQQMRDDNVPVRRSGCNVVGRLFLGEEDHERQRTFAVELLPALIDLLADSASDVRRAAARNVRRFAKACPEATAARGVELVKALSTTVRDPSMAVKMCAERAMLHVLQIHSNPARLPELAGDCDEATATFLTSYARRVLRKLPVDSGPESDDD